uniref:Cytochrome c domain-containing protein n=1 Tax=Solibacter usitatus (strain Ellin6076) TaxID=234267 RepID=Q029N9_SOLUE
MGRRVSVIGLLLISGSSYAADDGSLERRFSQDVRPFLASYCIACHSGNSAAAQFDLKAYTDVALVVRDYPRWNLVLEKLAAGEMPPKMVKQPPVDARNEVIEWVKAVRSDEARKHAGDPGLVLARRLSNAEYNYTIRDLTGVDMRPTREFPVDPANTAGFDNSGESLTTSPALLNKYLQAAREVGDHMVLTPDGFTFAPHPMLVETDREKFAIKRIVDFYERQPTDYADYFQAAWRYKHRTGGPTLAATAAQSKVSAKYLAMVWDLLEGKADEVGPVGKLRGMWRALPAEGDVRLKCVEMRDFAIRIRNHTAMQFAAPLVRGLPAGSQPLLNWKLRQFTMHRRESDPKALRKDTDPPLEAPVIPKYPGLHQEAAYRWAALMDKARVDDRDLVVPAGEVERYQAAFARFASVFPDVFYVKERGRYFPDDSQDKGRLLSAGYHNVMGYWRDDAPLSELILDEPGQKELNRLWDEFDFIADYTAHTWVQYYFNQSGEVAGKGAESGTLRPSDKEVSTPQVIFELRDAYLAKAAASNNPVADEAIRYHFQWVNDTLRRVEKMRADAEPRHIDALLKFAGRAYRRPLVPAEREKLLGFYRSLREKNSLSHEEAIRDSVVSVLMSPKFAYRIDAGGTQQGAQPLSSYGLASRLSYFLWSSMPDEKLLAHAADGSLLKSDTLVAEARRMMTDDRARALAVEFGGNWLDFRRFEEHNAVDRDRFPSFTNDLREAMFEEPIRFLGDVIRRNGSVLDLLYGDYTFVNPVLAKHYGMPAVTGTPDTWVRVDGAGQYGRGGVLPMAVFLTQNAPGLRTSPVKRGYWVVRRVLGETIPPPPATVPELPHDEAKMDLPLREMLAKHRENPACAACHARFDSFGLAFEGYGPIGEKRTHDLAGHAVDTQAVFPGGAKGEGFAGVQTNIREHRQNDFLDNLSRKLLAYALGRSLMLSDEATVEQMRSALGANNYRFASLVETIVTSPQFVNKRNPDPPEKGR